MKLYEIINPSDKCCLALPDDGDDRIAIVACLLLGEGRYALTREPEGTKVCPLFLFGGAMEWLISEHQITDFGGWVKQHASDVADCLDSIFYGDAREHAALEAGLANVTKQAAAISRAAYNDRKRSSLNNIDRAARELAAWLRSVAKVATAEATQEGS